LGGLLSDELDLLLAVSWLVILCTFVDVLLTILQRKFAGFAVPAKAQMIPNFAIFGRPIEQGDVAVQCINRLILNQVQYDLVFGPVGYQ
jgi:hypothetical protein